MTGWQAGVRGAVQAGLALDTHPQGAIPNVSRTDPRQPAVGLLVEIDRVNVDHKSGRRPAIVLRESTGPRQQRCHA